MKVLHVNYQMREILEKILFVNECADSSLVTQFSDADGARSGKSGYSFGRSQFDINNNPNALIALEEMGFTTDEIAALRRQDADLNLVKMNAKLAINKDIIDAWDDKQIDECLNRSAVLCSEIGVDFKNIAAFMMVADYHNQLRFSRGGKLFTFLQRCAADNELVTAKAIRDFKYTIPWGQERKDDVDRRYETVTAICNGVA